MMWTRDLVFWAARAATKTDKEMGRVAQATAEVSRDAIRFSGVREVEKQWQIKKLIEILSEEDLK